jgi:hypothetical protein
MNYTVPGWWIGDEKKNEKTPCPPYIGEGRGGVICISHGYIARSLQIRGELSLRVLSVSKKFISSP